MGATYITFVITYLDGDTSIVSAWYEPVTTQPLAGVGFCLLPKSCSCPNIPEVNATMLSDDVNYYGVNDSVVNSSLAYIAMWDTHQVQLTCKGMHDL